MVLVVSPLVMIMEDQVNPLQLVGVAAVYFRQDLTDD